MWNEDGTKPNLTPKQFFFFLEILLELKVLKI
jgi:hypothetical protein